ncbi:MAG: heat-inducible transcriptional repressor HrcA [Deltaproteobacteria bacterium]|nr:heat-inducible transcriptional repressor HrcA [Deltaproteobacteria bacterium]
MKALLDDRDAQVLRIVVEDYVSTAEPVGSRTISKEMGNLFSPATIRNIMADLEEMGYLAQPHTSAGRIPTGAGFRYYVDYLLARRELARADRDRLARMAGEEDAPAEEMVRHVSRIASNISRQACVVILPQSVHQPLHSINLVRAGADRILVIAVLQGGWVQHRVIEGENGLTPEDIEKINNYLNSFAVGLTLPQLRAKVLREMKQEKARYDRLIRRALLYSARMLADSDDAEVYVEGRANILDQPEFMEDLQKLKRILRAFEEKSIVVRLLDRAIESGAVQISIGPENELEEFRDVSVVASGYRRGESAVGGIGLIGPVRMDYPRVIPLVEHAARLLSSLFEHR